MYAAQAIPAVSRSWLHASARRGVFVRAMNDPALLPNPRPMRKTARMIENVYTDAPSISDSVRVHTTSAPSAVSPDRPIARYTVREAAETGVLEAAAVEPASVSRVAMAAGRCGAR